jgi:anti-anti-sigma factor
MWDMPGVPVRRQSRRRRSGRKKTWFPPNRDGRLDMISNSLSRGEFSTRRQNGYAVATIRGELDIASVPALREELLGLLGPHANRIVVDLSGVTFCDTSGLAMLVGVGRRAWLLGGVLRLAAPAPPVTAVLRLAGLERHFEIFPTVSEAAGGLTRTPGGVCATLN